VAEGARLESVFRGNSNLGSNPSLSAIKSFSIVRFAHIICLFNDSLPNLRKFNPERDWRAVIAQRSHPSLGWLLCSLQWRYLFSQLDAWGHAVQAFLRFLDLELEGRFKLQDTRGAISPEARAEDTGWSTSRCRDHAKPWTIGIVRIGIQEVGMIEDVVSLHTNL
jgi:hypothetical protein